MTSEAGNSISDLIDARVKIAFLGQQLSEAVHLFYVTISWILTIIPDQYVPKVGHVIRIKVLQMPQGYPLGQHLIELDEQNGGLLESKGILLSRWVYEPRENRNG